MKKTIITILFMFSFSINSNIADFIKNIECIKKGATTPKGKVQIASLAGMSFFGALFTLEYLRGGIKINDLIDAYKGLALATFISFNASRLISETKK